MDRLMLQAAPTELNNIEIIINYRQIVPTGLEYNTHEKIFM
jgi:hypothetical protein